MSSSDSVNVQGVPSIITFVSARKALASYLQLYALLQ